MTTKMTEEKLADRKKRKFENSVRETMRTPNDGGVRAQDETII